MAVPLLDINNAGQYNSLDAAQNRSANFVGQVAPLAPTWHVENAPGPVPYSAPYQSQSNISKFTNFVGSIGSSIGHIGEAAGGWLAHNAAQLITSPVRFGADLGHGLVAAWSLNNDSKQGDMLNSQLDSLISQYKNGQISGTEYKKALNSWTQDYNNFQSGFKADQQRLSQSGKAAIGSGIDVGATIATILTGGIAGFAAKDVGVSTAAKFMASDSADVGLLKAAANLSQLGAKGAFDSLSPEMQFGINRVMAETMADMPAHLTAGQLSRAAVANLAFKYPVYYNVLAGGGEDIYHKLDDKQYGAAIQSAAFNALVLLSGGIFGQAMKYGGRALNGLNARTFGQTAFLDELSRLIGNGDPAGLYKAINAIKDPEARAEAIKMMKAAEATNLAAVGGSEPVAAANRVFNGMKDAYGIDFSKSTHAEELANMVNHFKAQQLANEVAKRLGVEGITVGRFDPAMRNRIAKGLEGGTSVQDRLQLWENLKKSDPNQAWSNNPNLDKQIKQLITDNPNVENLTKAIKNIDARFPVDGFTTGELDQLAKLGYIPIKPKTLAAPFKAGEGKLASAFAQNNDLFIKSITPLPILRPVGQLLTGMGLSPNASNSRVYQLFNSNLAENIKNLTVTKDIAERLGTESVKVPAADVAKATDAWAQTGLSAADIAYAKKFKYTPEEAVRKFGGGGGQIVQRTATAAETASIEPTTTEHAADYIIKKLSNYAKSPPNGKIIVRPAFADLRQLGVKDIKKALDVSSYEAKDVQQAISKAMLQVPLDVRGLGDRLVDISYPALRKFLRIQGATRFSYNPFFQYLRLIPKTEILTESEGGGVLKSIFAGRWSQISKIRQQLRSAGAFDEPGRFGTVISGEAVEATGAMSRNLTKKLLPMQERSIAGLIDAQATKMGMNVDEYIKAFPENVRNTVQAIAQYDRHANFLNSPMMKTLNIAVFPLRFETKVAGYMARALANSHPITQVAFLKGLMGAHDWLTSPEGQAWYSANSDAIGLFKYITPVATLNEVFQSLLPGHDHHLGNFGELGGLPFGFIPMLTDSLGMTDFKQPGVNPKTGAIYADYIPVSDRGRVAVAIQDFLGMLFSYPGATAGLPSKTKITSSVANAVTGTNSQTDFTKVTPGLSPQAQQFSDIVHQLNGTAPSNTVTPPPSTGQSVPPSPTDVALPLIRPSAKKPRAARKSDFKPALLPGQTSYGQLP